MLVVMMLDGLVPDFNTERCLATDVSENASTSTVPENRQLACHWTWNARKSIQFSFYCCIISVVVAFACESSIIFVRIWTSVSWRLDTWTEIKWCISYPRDPRTDNNRISRPIKSCSSKPQGSWCCGCYWVPVGKHHLLLPVSWSEIRPTCFCLFSRHFGEDLT